jgi:hypothetical protein
LGFGFGFGFGFVFFFFFSEAHDTVYAIDIDIEYI